MRFNVQTLITLRVSIPLQEKIPPRVTDRNELKNPHSRMEKEH